MTAPVERKLPGEPIHRERLVAEWEDLHHRNLMKGPVASFLFDVHYSVPEKTYQWRVQLNCGCVRDIVTREHREEERADDVARLAELADEYYFSVQKPSPREVSEAIDTTNKEVEEGVRREMGGREPTVRPNRPSIHGVAVAFGCVAG